ncbi:MAG: hypothetical protein ACJ8AI_27195 [Rhodopila sp.]
MPIWIAGGLLILSVALVTGPSAQAAQPSFADLLARAQVQADAGHHWGPPDDNLADTIMMLFQLAPTATPEQLSAFADLLERDRKNLQQAPAAADTSPVVIAPPTKDTSPAVAAPSAKDASPVAAAPPAADTPPAVAVPPAADAQPVVAAPSLAVEPSPKRKAPTVANVPPTTIPPPAIDAPPAAAHPRQSVPTMANIPSAAVPPPAAISPPAIDVPPVAASPSAAGTPPAAALPPSAGTSAALTAPAPAKRPMVRPPDPHAAELFARGKAAEAQGDISGARRFYASAAERGHAAAARNLGRLYDPAVLEHIAVGGVFANPDLARQWYERAAELGDREASPLLQALTAR